MWSLPEINHGLLTKYNWLVLYPENLTLGVDTDIGAFSLIMAKNGVHIGDNVMIGSHVAIYSASTIDSKSGPVTIHRNAKIGSHSVIMPNVTIGENSIIGAFSYVVRDIPPNTVVFGIPASKGKELL
jgi:acetyltransferase-like isoleucine patch superfamily enzyme